MKLYVALVTVGTQFFFCAIGPAEVAAADVRFEKIDATTFAIYDSPDFATPIGQVQFGLTDAGTGHFLAPGSDVAGHVAARETGGIAALGIADVYYDGADALPFQTYFQTSLKFTFPNSNGPGFQSFEFGFGNVGVNYLFDLGSLGMHRFHVEGTIDPNQTDIGFVIPIVYSAETAGATDFFIAPTIRRSFNGQLNKALPLYQLTISGEQLVPEPGALGVGAISGAGIVMARRRKVHRRGAELRRQVFARAPRQSVERYV